MSAPRFHVLPLLLVAQLLSTAKLSAQVVTGVVMADSTQTVAAAEVLVIQENLLRRVVTDQRGRFTAHVDTGAFELRVSALGFDTIHSGAIRIEPSQRIVVQVFMTPRPLALDPVTVKARMPIRFGRDGFAFRMARSKRTGMGQFLGEADIERYHPMNVTSALRYLPFVIRPGASSNRGPTTFTSAQYGVRAFGPCMSGYTIYLDGSPSMFNLDDIDDIIIVEDIQGIEVYRRPMEVPGEFGAGANGCGVIAIWTK